jgi:Arc/MetJ-type ribon-helix-helix transcriptional regulator
MEHILPPVTFDDRLPWWSVNVHLPPEIDQEIRRYVEEDELTSWTLMIHGALYMYRTLFWTREQLRAELENMIEEGIRSAEQDGGREATPAFWAEFRRKAERDAERLDQLQVEERLATSSSPKNCTNSCRSASRLATAIRPRRWSARRCRTYGGSVRKAKNAVRKSSCLLSARTGFR